MSAYKVIATEFRRLDDLLAALEEVLGKENFQVSADNDLHLYGYAGDRRPEQVSVRIPRQVVNQYSGGWSNDIGYRWNGTSYELISSEYDNTRLGVTDLQNKVKQNYAHRVLRRQAASKGYSIQETRQPGGTIQLTLVRR